MVFERVHEDAVAGVGVGILLLDRLADDVHFGLRLRVRDAGLDARDHLNPVADALLLLIGDDERRPEFALRRGKREARRHDADDGKAASVEIQLLAQDVAAAEAALPQPPAD